MKAKKNHGELASRTGTRHIKSQQGPPMEDKLRVRAEAAERAAAAAGPPDLEEEKVQWENRIAEPRKRKDAVLQGQVWATGSNHLGGTGVQRGEVRINSPGLQGGAKATLPSRVVTRGMDSPFFDD